MPKSKEPNNPPCAVALASGLAFKTVPVLCNPYSHWVWLMIFTAYYMGVGDVADII
jgi:hypothetical protein